MNWEALGALGEIVGAVGVIVTLGYLSIQIRQNTRAVRGSTLNVLTQHHVEELRWAGELGGPLLQAMNAPDELSAEDEFKLTEYFVANLVVRQNEFVQFQQGLLSEADWKSREGIIRLSLGFEWARRWWRSFPKEVFNSEFVRRVDRIVAEGTLPIGETYGGLGTGRRGETADPS